VGESGKEERNNAAGAGDDWLELVEADADDEDLFRTVYAVVPCDGFSPRPLKFDP
jgi:hypothetical protein